MTIINKPEEIKILEEGGEILANVLKEVAIAVKPGISSLELDELAERLIRKNKGRPSFKGYDGYPASLCVSINEEIVHGIPLKDKFLKEGDIVGLDLGMKYKGFFTDVSLTVGVGKINEAAKKLIEITKNSLEIGLNEIFPGKYIGDIGFAIQKYIESNNFSVVRQLAGHGVGRKIHDDPLVPNYGKPGEGEILKEGMVLAIEPMVNMGGWRVLTKGDGWTVVTADGSLSAHFEKTIIINESGCKILTPF